MDTPSLKRPVSLPMLVFFGVGTIVGGGFYALVGKVAGEAGMFAPVAMLLASLIALLSARSYAELSSRLPVSAGEAEYITNAFGRRWLGAIVGWMVILTGLVSAALLARAIVGFLSDFVAIPLAPSVVVIVLLLGAIAAWGISESVWISVVITAIEVGGILLVIGLRGDVLADLPARVGELTPSLDLAEWQGIGVGAFLIFYAFIGFEDMVNIVEEVREPKRTMPRGIMLALIFATALYVMVTTVAVLAVPPDELAATATPFALMVADYGPVATSAIGGVAVLAGVNGALVQIIMAARVAYGMGRSGGAPLWFRVINSRTRTPLRATCVITVAVGAVALWLPLTTLARVTSAIILVVFALVNASLFVIRVRESRSSDGDRLRYRDAIPVLGVLACLAFLVFQASQAL